MRQKTFAVVLLTLVVAVAWAQPGGQGKAGGGRGGGGTRMMANIDQDWAALCFEINLSATQIEKLRPTFQWAWKARNSALKSAMASRSFDGAAKTMASVSKTVDERIPIVLTKTQLAQWTKYKAEQAKLRDQFRSRAGQRGGKGGKS